MTPSAPVDAATVVLLRDGDPFEVLMVQRHRSSRFMGGMYVYPGGKRDPADSEPHIAASCHGMDAQTAARVLGGNMPPYDALGHFVAAVRETFEEAGVLLAVTARGQPIDVTVTGIDERLAQARQAIQTGDMSMHDLMQELGWRMDLGALRYYAHWITPKVEPRRFSARFLLARAPANQQGSLECMEITDCRWISPRAALDAYANRTFVCAPPTLRVLQEIVVYESVHAALDAAPHTPVTAMAPEFADDNGIPCLVLTGDPLHPEDSGNTKRRFELREGTWETEFPD
jgi:8-oxo-dGTP pyrophosphatase MutT (NUDIX family)